MCRFFFVAILTISSLYSFAHEIKGEITDSNKVPLPYADLIVQDSSKNMVAYAITDSKGVYTMSFETDLKQVWVQANFMGYDKVVKKVDLADLVTLNFELKERTEEIAAVNISAKAPVQIEKNDTVVFNLARLTNGQEEVVEDILKKLPGVEVDESGQMKYKGKRVSKMLLDGDDLFQSNYGLGSKNIQAKHIAGVEAIQNYSENPLLRGIENSDEIAMNLKFKSGLSLSHSLSAAYGSNDKYAVDYTNIAVTKKVKAFSYLNFNSLALEQSPYSSSNPAMYMSYDKSSGFENPGYLETGTKSSMFKSRSSNFNDALSASLNVLPHISESLTVRLNMNFMTDNAEDRVHNRTVIQAEMPIVIEEKKLSEFKPQYLKGDLNIKKFISQDVSFENITKFSFFKNTSKYSGTTNDVAQYYKSHSQADFFYNESNLTKRINTNNGIKFNAVFSKSDTPEDLYVNPGIDLNTNTNTATNTQSVKNKKQQFQFKTDFYHRTQKKDRLNLGVSLNHMNRDLLTNLTDNNLNIINDIDFKKADYEVSTSYRWKRKHWEIVPLIRYNYLDYAHSEKDGTQSLYNTSLRMHYRPSNKHDFNLSVNSNQQGIDDNKVFTNYILSSNRALSKYELDYGVLKQQSFNLRYTYLNSISYDQVTLSLSGTQSNKAYLSLYDIYEDVSYTRIYLGGNDSKNLRASLMFMRPAKFLYGQIRLVGGYNYMEYASQLNGVFRNNYIHTQNIRFNWESLVVWNFVFTNNLSYSHSDYGSYGNESLTNRFKLIFQKGKFRLATQLKYYRPSLDMSRDELKLNTKLQYTYKQLKFTCEGVNLLNKKQSNTINQNDFMSMENYSVTQGRYVLLGVSFKF